MREETEIETSRDKERQRNTLWDKEIFGEMWRDIVDRERNGDKENGGWHTECRWKERYRMRDTKLS